MGPERSELRRMAIRRSMYANYFEYFKDPVVPFDIATDVANPGWRTGVQMMMGAFGIDTAKWICVASIDVTQLGVAAYLWAIGETWHAKRRRRPRPKPTVCARPRRPRRC